ncbi:MAG: primase [Methanolobus sp.]|jgi:DNA primase|uniref:DNA primase DnaG n=1 Tax=Methanolobus tindarius DSM 2278 TaxID=1090322 RepID=W9DR73_METTI|nr:MULTISPECIES: DNA primase DnaG [Methanolobus]ETA67995.1 DNA primase [Methanolobus tindarius DSM 2278]MDK2831926.1 primase [Methanolobus sp.]MDK2938371.1 primase [Methanolobus sp.]
MQNADTTKYIIHSKISADGIIERPDIVGAIFGQTEGLLGSDLDLRDLQKTGRIGRIEVVVNAKGGKTKGTILIPSSLDKVETSILAASLETIDRVGPCSAKIEVTHIEDVRATKRHQIIERAKFIFKGMFDENLPESQEIADEVRQSVRVEEMQYYGKNKIPCGPTVFDSDAIIVVEGRADVLNLLKYGIKNTICVGGTNVPPEVAEFTRKKDTVTAFTDGDRGGELIIKELVQVANIDYIARAPDGKSVEDLVQKEIVRSLRQKVPVEQVIDKYVVKDQAAEDNGRVQRLPKRKERRATPSSAPASEVKRVGTSAVKRAPRETRGRDNRKKSPRDQKPREDRETTEKKPVVPKSKVPTSPENKRFKNHANDLIGTFSARFLDGGDNVVNETAVRDLVSTLKDYESEVKTVVFDGVVTQRILDIAADKGIERLIGAKVGSVTKRPASVKVLTASSL